MPKSRAPRLRLDATGFAPSPTVASCLEQLANRCAGRIRGRVRSIAACSQTFSGAANTTPACRHASTGSRGAAPRVESRADGRLRDSAGDVAVGAPCARHSAEVLRGSRGCRKAGGTLCCNIAPCEPLRPDCNSPRPGQQSVRPEHKSSILSSNRRGPIRNQSVLTANYCGLTGRHRLLARNRGLLGVVVARKRPGTDDSQSGGRDYQSGAGDMSSGGGAFGPGANESD